MKRSYTLHYQFNIRIEMDELIMPNSKLINLSIWCASQQTRVALCSKNTILHE